MWIRNRRVWSASFYAWPLARPPGSVTAQIADLLTWSNINILHLLNFRSFLATAAKNDNNEHHDNDHSPDHCADDEDGVGPWGSRVRISIGRVSGVIVKVIIICVRKKFFLFLILFFWGPTKSILGPLFWIFRDVSSGFQTVLSEMLWYSALVVHLLTSWQSDGLLWKKLLWMRGLPGVERWGGVYFSQWLL